MNAFKHVWICCRPGTFVDPDVKRLSITNVRRLEQYQPSTEHPSLDYTRSWLQVSVTEQMFLTHLSIISVLGLNHQYEVLWLLCADRLVSKIDNVMYSIAHTFCWLHSRRFTEILSGWFELWTTIGPRWLSLHLWSHNVRSGEGGECYPANVCNPFASNYCTQDIGLGQQME